MASGAFAIWCVEPDGSRQLVRDDLTDQKQVNQLVAMGNHGAEIRRLGHRYVAEPVEAQPQAADALGA